MARWKTNNMVVSVDLNVNIPLEKLAVEVPEAEYNPEQFPGLILRFGDNKPTTLIFNSGRIIVTGGKSIKEVKEIVEKIRGILKKMGIDTPSNYKLNVQNYVVAGNFDYTNIDITKMVSELENVQYDPEQFPGAIVKYQKEDINVTFLVFKTGRFVCTGAKSDEELEKAIIEFEKDVISKYAKS